MKFGVLFFIVFLGLALIPPSAFAVHGYLMDLDGQRVLNVWGDNYDMGYAHGYFLGEDIMEMMGVYIFPPPEAGPLLYESARLFVRLSFDFPQNMLDEARGIADGMIDGGVDPYVEVLHREFDFWDIITLNSLADIKALFCATLIGWNTTTAMDPTLLGTLAVTHNTDFIAEPEAPLMAAEKSVIIAYSPSDPNRQRWVSIGNAGMLGVPAGLNESGIGIIINKGLAFDSVEDPIMKPKPQIVGWSAREALSMRDFDGDGKETILDVLKAFEDTRQFSSTINQVFGPPDRSDPPAAALEINNKSRVVRWPADDPTLYPDVLLALNWEDKLEPERNELNEERYQTSITLINVTYQRRLTLENMWDFLVQLQPTSEYFLTQQSMVFVPEQMRFALAISNSDAAAPEQSPVWHDFDDCFFDPPTGELDDDDTADDDTADDDAADDDVVNDDQADDDQADDDQHADDDSNHSDDADNADHSDRGCA